jgi:hypothetical protein
MARRGMWLIGGVAVGMGALVLKPDSRTWLRRRLGLESEDRRWFEEDDPQPAEHEGDEPLDTREARFSLRARLAEEGNAEPAPSSAPLTAAPPPPPPPPPPLPPPAYAPPVLVEAEPEPEPAVEPEPAIEPEPAPEPIRAWRSPASVAPAPEPAPAPAFESVPPLAPEEDAPKSPGEDTSEIEPVPSAAEPPPPPPTPIRPAAPPPQPSRPFSGEGASFRSAIDAARERVHGAAREATPDEGESTEPIDGAD